MENLWISESAQPVALIASTSDLPIESAAFVLEGQKVSVCLITEGLGNRRDMNMYGPEAIDSAPAIFEGAHCFLNHPSFTEERDIPERRVQDMCGYFKNVHVDMSKGMRSVVGELHFDLSETGRMAYDKCCTALHYQTEFPGSDKEYIGLSVNASGASEPREISLDGETVTVNYVTRFTEAMSCDVVTLPARGGKFLTLVESAAGADIKNKEVRKMMVKELQAAQSDLKEAATITDPEKKAKKLAEAQKRIDAILKDVLESQARQKKESGKSKEADVEEGKDDPAAETAPETTIPPPGHKVKKTVSTTVHHTSDGATEDDTADEPDKTDDTEESSEESDMTAESNRLAVKQLIHESGLKPSYFDVEELSRKGLKEAKAEIARVRRISEANAKEILEAVTKVSPSHAAKLNESGKRDDKSRNNDLFAGCTL